MLRSAQPNPNHFALAAGQFDILTTNQDLLIEAAAATLDLPSNVLHLHGRCDRPTTIITLISQYVAGLPEPLSRQFKQKLEERHVLVLGYSGRDRDIMPLIEHSSAKHIEWILHPGAPESPELRRLRSRLGDRITVCSEWACMSLMRLLTLRQRAMVLRGVKKLTMEPALHDQVQVSTQFASIGRLERNLGLAAVLRHASFYRDAERIYAALGGTEDNAPASLRLAIASSRLFQQHFDDAVSGFDRVLSTPGAGFHERADALLGKVEAFRNTSQGVAAVRSLRDLLRIAAKMPRGRKRARCFGRAASHAGGIARVDGNLAEAAVQYSSAVAWFRRSRDLDEQLENKCWRGDVLRMRGHYRRAHAMVSDVLEDSMLYVRHRVRAWAYLVSADIDCGRGQIVESARWLALAAQEFSSSENPQGLVWTDLVRATLLRTRGDLSEAEGALDDAERRSRDGAAPRHLAQARLHLERAEVARGKHQGDMIGHHLRQLTDLLHSSKHFSTRPEYLYLQAALVNAEFERDRGRDMANDLSSLGVKFERLGLKGLCSRAYVAAWLNGGGKYPVELLRSCRAHNRQHEVARLERAEDGFYPIIFA